MAVSRLESKTSSIALNTTGFTNYSRVNGYVSLQSILRIEEKFLMIKTYYIYDLKVK
jgi:hypothetical protein